MGIAKIAEIAAVFAGAGKPELPVAVIQDASLPQQKEVFGQVFNIAAAVQKSEIYGPAVIVLGEVVKHRIISNEIRALGTLLQQDYAAQ